MGVTSHILSTFARKPVFAYRAMVMAIFAIGFISYIVWGHHMFMSGMSPYSAMAFSITTMAVGVPSAIKTFNWLATLWGGRIRFTTPMLFALGFVSLFVSGGVTGMLLAQPAVDVLLHDTYFVVAHFHIIMGVAAIFGIFAGTHYWFPKMFGRMMSERLGKIHFWLTLVGVYAIFMPMHFLGIQGGLRRYAQVTEFDFLRPLQPVHVFISIAAFVTVAAQLLFLFNFFWSLKKGERAPVNPWQATSLEWTIPSPPPHDNFGEIEPVVYRGPYEYGVPGAAQDFIMQTEPAAQEAK
jgi:cytochrome c oxidase subunit 1